MSWLDMHGNPNSGVMVLQHEGYNLQDFDLDFRAFKAAVRLVRRPLIGGIEFGQWQEDVDTRGDIIGGHVWQADYSRRPISAWRFAWPVTTVDGSVDVATGGGPRTGASVQFGDRPSVATGGGSSSGGGDGECQRLSSMSMLPLWNNNFEEDDRFVPVTVKRPKYGSGEKLWPKFPHGWKGISLIADNENTQIEYYLPVDPRLVAVNRGGDPEMGTNIVDMGEDLSVDPLRHSRLHTLVRVIKGPESQYIDFHDRNSIAINLTESGCEDTHGGFWMDQPKGSDPSTKFRVIAAWSDHKHGPMLAGSIKDKHNIGSDMDGNPMHSGHLALLVNWWHSKEEDAPFMYDGPFSYKRGSKPGSYTPGTHFTDVWFEYDKNMSHQHLSGQKKGRFKWRATTLVYTPDGGGKGEPTPGGDPPIGEPVETPGGGGGVGEPTPTEGGGGGGEAEPTPTEGGGGRRPTPTEGGGGGGELLEQELKPGYPSGFGRKQYIGALQDFAVPAFLGRPQIVNNETWMDLRSAITIPRKIIRRHDRQSPIVGRLEWFTSIDNGQIQYTQRPKAGKGSRYRGGTAPGGLVLMSPEVDMADWDAATVAISEGPSPDNLANYPPPGTTTSDSHLIAASVDSFISWGVPDFSTGGVRHGMQTHVDAEGQWNMEAVDADGVATSVMSIDQNGKVTVPGLFDPTGVVMSEQASAPTSVLAGEGMYWVLNTAPTTPIFTDDTDTARSLLMASDLSGLTQDQIVTVDADGFLTDAGTDALKGFVGATEVYRANTTGLRVDPGGVGGDPSHPLHVVGKGFITGELELDGDFNHDGTNFGVFSTAPAPQTAAYTLTNVTTTRTINADTISLRDLADVVGTMIADQQSFGFYG